MSLKPYCQVNIKVLQNISDGITLPMFFLSNNDCKEYHLEGRLLGHRNAINCLAVSRNGSLLASGGELQVIQKHNS